MNINTEMIVALVGVLLVLALNWRSIRANPAPTSAKVRMLLIWGVVIVGLVLIVKLFQA
jgi:hypothetical protein